MKQSYGQIWLADINVKHVTIWYIIMGIMRNILWLVEANVKHNLIGWC